LGVRVRGEVGEVYALAGVRVERIIEEEARVVVEAMPTASCGTCPACG